MKLLKVIVLTFSILFNGIFIVAQVEISPLVDSLVQLSMNRIPQAGIAVAVVKDGEIIHSKGYGITSVESGEKVNEHTRFSIASNSKAFTSMALAILVDEGKINWRDKVIDYITEFKMYDPYLTAEFTIQDLLAHRSGLDQNVGDLMFLEGGNFNVDDIIKSIRYHKPVTSFRTDYGYTSTLYIIAGELIKRLSGMSYSQFVEERIMKPLGMTESAGLYRRLENKANVALPHTNFGGKLNQLTYRDMEISEGSGSIQASIYDLSKWMIMHLNGGKYGSNLEDILVSYKNHSEMWRPHTNIFYDASPEDPNGNHYFAYGMGWFLQDYEGRTVVSHPGGSAGMHSKITLVPEIDLGVVVLTNSGIEGFSHETISRSIVQLFLNHKPVDWFTRMENMVNTWLTKGDSILNNVWNNVDSVNSGDLNLDQFTGTYKDDWFGKIEISKNGDCLYFKSLRSPKLRGPMYFYKANTFAVKWEEFHDMGCDAFANFTLDEQGKAVAFKMKWISPYTDFSFDFNHLDLKRID